MQSRSEEEVKREWSGSGVEEETKGSECGAEVKHK